jgi:TonB family protein
MVAFTISEMGSVADPRVVQSSGYADLDAAAVECISTWKYRPATQNGSAVAVPWKAVVQWGKPTTAVLPPPRWVSDIASKTRECAIPPVLSLEHLTSQGTTVIQVKFSGGKVVDAQVALSSGDEDLDSRVLNCINALPPNLAAEGPDGISRFGFAWSALVGSP